MRPTADFLEERFGEFNQTFFGDALPPIPILLSDVKSYAGMYVHRRRTSGVTRQIKINVRMDLPREVYEDTLLHEMIHYAIDLSGKRDDAPRNPYFNRFPVSGAFTAYVVDEEELMCELSDAAPLPDDLWR